MLDTPAPSLANPPHPSPCCQAPTKESILAFLEGKLAKWWLPADVVFVKGGPASQPVAVVGAALRCRWQGGRRCACAYAFVVGKPVLPSLPTPPAEIPHTATGKISKLALRQQFKDYRPPPTGAAAAASRSRL